MNLHEELAKPFPAEEIRWKPQVVKGGRALVVAYVDARAVEDRLDTVFGPGGWQDGYTLLPSGEVNCTLRVKIDGEWVAKSDVGSANENSDDGDRLKGAFSDALKRASVKLGIGRYLYRLPCQWVDYDDKKKSITGTPVMPKWATPSQSQAKASEAKANPDNITVAQWEDIKKALKQRQIDPKQLLDHMKVEKPRQIPANRYQEAMHFMNGKAEVPQAAPKPAGEEMEIDLGKWGKVTARYELIGKSHTYSIMIGDKEIKSGHWNKQGSLKNFRSNVIHHIANNGKPQESGRGPIPGFGNFAGD